jgi:hypothetical protein
MKIFKSKFDEFFSIKVWLKKVKHLCTGAQNPVTTEGGTGASIFNQGLPEKL